MSIVVHDNAIHASTAVGTGSMEGSVMRRTFLNAVALVAAWTPVFCVGLTGIVVTATPARAQTSVAGTVHGVVTDEQGGALPGVTVTATSPSVPGAPRTAVTDADGTYRLVNLPPAVFDVSAELSGFSKFIRQAVEIRASVNIKIDITMTLGSMSETIVVSGEAPLLETEKPIQSINIAGDYQRVLPLTTRRDYSDFLEVTPGVTARSFIANNGTQVYMLRGTDVENHVIQVDGADIGSPRQAQPTFVHISADAIVDTQIKTGGADASAPIGLGVVLNVATKSGTNRFAGSLSTSIAPRSWNGNNNPDGVPTISESVDAEVALGGPVLRDRLWFFGSYRYLHRNSQISRNAAQLEAFRKIDPNWQPFDNRTRGKYGFFKLNAQLTSKHQWYAFFQADGTPEDGNQSTNFKRISLQTQGGEAAATRLYSAWTDALSSTLVVAWNNKSNTRDFSDFDSIISEGPSLRIYDSAFLSAGRLTGNGLIITTGNLASINESPSEKVSIQTDLTWYKKGWLGSHQFQTGLFLQPRLYNGTRTRYLNDGFTIEDVVLNVSGDISKGYRPFHRQYVDQIELQTASFNSENYAIYVQDAWKPGMRLTLTGGLRVDTVKSRDKIFDVVTQDSVEWGPRFGATYLLTGNGRHVVNGSISRISSKPENAFLPTLGGAVNVGLIDRYDNAGNGTFSTVFTTPAQSRIAANRSIDPDRHQPYTDEFLVSYRTQLPKSISASATFIQRNYKDLGALVDVNVIYENGVFKGYRDPAQNAILNATNNTWNHLVYRGMEFVIAQRTDRSQFLAGYTRMLGHVAGTWQPDDPGGIIQPDAFANDKGIGSIRGNENNSLSGTAQTRSPMWIPHTLRISGSYRLPWEVTVASNLTYQSGAWTGPIIDRVAAPDPRFGPTTLTLSNGRVVSNPLATVLRFAYDTRGDGQVQAPALFTWNMKFSRKFNLAGAKLDASLSIINLTNADADQEFFGGTATTANSGSNQLFSPNYAYAPDGTFRGQNRQAARAAQLLLRLEF